MIALLALACAHHPPAWVTEPPPVRCDPVRNARADCRPLFVCELEPWRAYLAPGPGGPSWPAGGCRPHDVACLAAAAPDALAWACPGDTDL